MPKKIFQSEQAMISRTGKDLYPISETGMYPSLVRDNHNWGRKSTGDIISTCVIKSTGGSISPEDDLNKWILLT